ncbi:beta-ketoacyl synthase [Pontiella sp.]|uniref:beta-ketoacyl-[acyl-carrier-protein] synthase family protein n=1 Tax=Pontiella sp. TaxID=2837462 RepID=UPI0035613393
MIGKNRVVITGLGVLAANGIGKEAFWNSLLAGESGIGPITLFDASDIPWKLAGEVKGFTPTDYLDKKLRPKRENRGTQLLATAAQMAIKDAKLNRKELASAAPILVTIGTTLGGLDLVEIHNRRLESKGIDKGLTTVSYCLHIKGPSVISKMLDVPTRIGALSNSCTGGLDAIASAFSAVQRGETEIAVAGGTDAVVIPSVVTGLGYAGLLSKTSDDPRKVSRPFDLLRTGGFLGEGAGVVVIESMDGALARGATPYAEIVGYSTTCDYIHMKDYGFKNSMEGALLNAGFMPKDISYINAHGSSDIALDQMETEAIKATFGPQAYNIPVASIKGVTGNPLAAGGAIQTISTCLSYANGTIPPTANLEVPDPACDLDYVPLYARQHDLGISIVNSRGIGGVNSSLLLRNLD